LSKINQIPYKRQVLLKGINISVNRVAGFCIDKLQVGAFLNTKLELGNIETR